MKKVLILFLTITLFASMTSASALQFKPTEQSSNTSGTARVEETEWKYRSVDGVLQKRLWSITYGVWKTDWINCK